MYNTLVSIIIPIYNVQEYIADCLFSVTKQTHKNIEVILVDDCSCDESISIAEAILKPTDIKWKICRHEQNKGQSEARNTGVNAAEGEYFLFLDSDDMLSDNCIEILLDKGKESNAKMVYGNYIYLNNGKYETGGRQRKPDDIISRNACEAYFSNKTSTAPWNRLISLSWYRETGVCFVAGSLHEDEPWSFSLALRCPGIDYVNDITYIYRQRELSTVHDPAKLEKRAQGLVAWVKESYSEVSKLGSNLPSNFHVFHNHILNDSIYAIGKLLPDNANSYINQALRYAWIPNLRAIADLSSPWLRIFYYLRRLSLPNMFAYRFACRIAGLKSKLTQR